MGKYLWVYLCIGLFFLLILPENVSNNEEPLYVNTKHYSTDEGYSHIVRVKYKDLHTVKRNLVSRHIGLYESYITIYFDSESVDDYYIKVENILEDLMDVSTNIKFLKKSEFNKLKYTKDGNKHF